MKKLFHFNGLFSIIFYLALIGLIWYLIIPRTGIFYRKYFYRPHIGQLNAIDLTLEKGEKFHLYVLDLNKRVTYSSTDIKVADVNLFGTVYALRTGNTVIKVKVDGKTLRCRVKVVDLSKKKITLKVGEKDTLKVKGARLGIKWSVVDKKIASIDGRGKVTAIREGTTTIKVKINDKVLSCKVIVTK